MAIDLVIVSPGVPLELPFIKALREAGKEIIGEIELAYRLAEGQIVAITGTNGKTTTTSLTGEIFKNAGKNTYVVGNIGVAAISKALEIKKEDYMVMEVSSFQLESIVTFRPQIAAILNLTPDHLNRHKTMENYKNAKFNLFKNQQPSDFAIINYDDEALKEESQGLKAKKVFFSRKLNYLRGYMLTKIKLSFISMAKGKRLSLLTKLTFQEIINLENALAAVAMAYVAGIEPSIIAHTLKTFQGVEHRLEYVDTVSGVAFINDSKGTNPDASIKALEAVKGPIVLLAGGMDKGSDFSAFIDAFQGKVKEMIVYGETALKLQQAARDRGFLGVQPVKDLGKQ
ncbi:UDP-N-acetylmuramoyl-L-alanine--D-glutamate ligase [Alkaliphilus crotonatoxidans]